MKEERKLWKKFSIYQIVSFVLIVLFVIGIIVTIPIMVSIKNKTDDAKKKNEEIEDVLDKNKPSESTSSTAWRAVYEKELIDLRL